MNTIQRTKEINNKHETRWAIPSNKKDSDSNEMSSASMWWNYK